MIYDDEDDSYDGGAYYWYDDDPGWVKEEPDCGLCGDGGSIRAGRLNRAIGRPWVRCPSCNPTWITRQYQRLSPWRLRWRLQSRVARWRGVELSDEPPF